jgi:hypothetical protein
MSDGRTEVERLNERHAAGSSPLRRAQSWTRADHQLMLDANPAGDVADPSPRPPDLARHSRALVPNRTHT